MPELTDLYIDEIGELDTELDRAAFNATPEIETANSLLEADPQRQAEVVIVRARRKPASGLLRLADIRDLPFLSRVGGTVPPPVTPATICSSIPGAKGKLIIYTPSANGSNYYIAPPNFSFNDINAQINRINNLARDAETAVTGAGGVGGKAAYFAVVVSEFIALVNTGRPYDWKSSGRDRLGPRGAYVTVDQGATVPIYEPFGNWAFGFFGAALGMSSDFLLTGASLAQFGSTRRLDDSRDRNNIAKGIAAFEAAYNSQGTAGGGSDPGDGSPTPIVVAQIKC